MILQVEFYLLSFLSINLLLSNSGINNLSPSLLQLHNLKSIKISSISPQRLLSQLLSPVRGGPLSINISSSPGSLNIFSFSTVQKFAFEFGQLHSVQVDDLSFAVGGIDEDVFGVDNVDDGVDFGGVGHEDDSAD